MKQKNIYSVESLEQLNAISSPIRQEILDTVTSKRKCSISMIAEELGRPADGLYYHIKALLKVGLLYEAGSNKTERQTELLYEVVDKADYLKVKYAASKPTKVKAINKMVSSMMKIAGDDFSNGIGLESVTLDGELRNLWAARVKCRLSDEKLRTANRLINELIELFQQSTDITESIEGELHSLVCVLAPVESKPKRR